jgi:hypothetical protein
LDSATALTSVRGCGLRRKCSWAHAGGPESKIAQIANTPTLAASQAFIAPKSLDLKDGLNLRFFVAMINSIRRSGRYWRHAAIAYRGYENIHARSCSMLLSADVPFIP